MTDRFDETPQNKVKRVPQRGSYDHKSIFEVIDAAWIGHIGIASPEGNVTVIPMLHARIDDTLIFHGANSSRLMKHLASGLQICVTFSLVDGLVLAKSLFHHSMNYRSAVVFGVGEKVLDESERMSALRAISDKIMPHRWDDARQPSEKEMAATAVVKLKIESASAKIRTGDPSDDEEDHSLNVWSGVVPFVTTIGECQTDSYSQSIPVPDYINQFKQQFNSAQSQ